MNIQGYVTQWHRKTHGTKPNAAVALKLAEESGELCKVINIVEHGAGTGNFGNWRAEDRAALRMELADVAICLYALAGRYAIELSDELIFDRLVELERRGPGAV